MSKISLEGNVSGSGTLTIAAPNTNSNFTLTLPTETGTIITNSGNQAGSFTTLNTSGAVVFNDAGADVDFRVEGDTDANLLFVDASTDRVGIGTNAPTSILTVGKTTDSVNTIVSTVSSTGVAVVTVNSNTVSALSMIANNSGNPVAGVPTGTLGFGTDGSAVPLVFTIGGAEAMRITSGNDFAITQAPGKYTVDVTGGITTFANNGTVTFANASGMLVVNNHSSGGVTIYLCGGGGTLAVDSVVGQVGTFAYDAGNGGYTWTNNSGSTAQFGFFFVRTRTTA
jgi:hypothetical protein